METKTKTVGKTTWKELNYACRQGFACNTEGCPCGATLGLFREDSSSPMDVRCDDCVVKQKSYKEQMEEKEEYMTEVELAEKGGDN